MLNPKSCFSEILEKSKFDVLNAVNGKDFVYTIKGSENRIRFDPDMLDVVETRPMYPTEKKAFAIKKLRSNDKIIHGLQLRFNTREVLEK